MQWIRIAMLVSLSFAFPVMLDAATTATNSDATIEAQCRPFFHDACSEAMGRWLPYRSFGTVDWSKAATKVPQADRFAYRVSRPAESLFDAGWPTDGTMFVHGVAGPPRGHAVYDPVRRIAFYHEGCCSWGETVEAIGVAPPPKPVARRDLQNLKTVRGAKLWQTPAEVRRLYGEARLQTVPGHPEEAVLSYRAPLVLPGARVSHGGCTADENFIFRNNHLFVIAFERGC